MKNIPFAVIGITGSFLARLLGGWDMALQTLIIFMIADYVTGLVVAGVFRNSLKTDHGALESKTGWKGLCKKCMTLLYVLIASQLDNIAGTDIIRNTVVIGFVANEALSILENGGLMGIKYPKKLKDAIELLNDKAGGDTNAN